MKKISFVAGVLCLMVFAFNAKPEGGVTREESKTTAQQPPAVSLGSMKADHAMIRVSNFEETMRWYEEKLGFKEEIRWTDASLPKINLAYLELNGFRLEIVGGGKPQQATATPANVEEHLRTQGYRHLCFSVDDVDATLAELNRRGVPTFVAAYNYPPLQRRLGFVKDNNGNVIEFSGLVTGKESQSE